MSEQWVPVVGYEGLYEVSSLGRVRGVERSARHRYGGTQTIKAKLLHLTCAGKYRQVVLCNGVSKIPIRVHTLVAKAFLGPPPSNEHEVCHCEGAAAGDCVSNLYWGTRKQNKADERRHGTLARGEKHGNAKLTRTNVETIKSKRADGVSLYVLAKQFNVAYQTVYDIVMERTWK
jgi:NUMOD4 motif